MLEEMNYLVKKAHERTMYIVEYAKLRKLTCMTLDNLYQSELTFVDVKFVGWQTLTDLNNPNIFFSV